MPSLAHGPGAAGSFDRSPDSPGGAAHALRRTQEAVLQCLAGDGVLEVEMGTTRSTTVAHGPIAVDWVGGSEFDARRPGGAKIRIDANARNAPSPFDVLLAALATCSAIDLVAILGKQRTPVTALHISVEAQRVDATPKRLASATLHFRITAPGATAAKAARAVELSVAKYCSVRSSLIADAPVTWTVALES